jgi:NAD+ synthase
VLYLADSVSQQPASASQEVLRWRGRGPTPDELLLIDPELVERVLCRFLRDEVRRHGFQKVILGLSGGVDSSLSAYLAVSALGSEHVLGVAMPYRTSSPDSLRHAELVSEKLGIACLVVPITEQIDAYFARFPEASRLRRANKMARERMTILYDLSMAYQALVLGTSNKTELLLGYGTLYGDLACAINAIADLYKSQVWQLARYVGVPQEIVDKKPTADLWVGQTDEDELGFSYRDVDRLLVLMVDERWDRGRLVEAGFDPTFVDRVGEMIRRSQYKRTLPIFAKLSQRTIGRDFRYSRDWGT